MSDPYREDSLETQLQMSEVRRERAEREATRLRVMLMRYEAAPFTTRARAKAPALAFVTVVTLGFVADFAWAHAKDMPTDCGLLWGAWSLVVGWVWWRDA